ncbi:FkbM family methyltransferase [Bradyrhizobium betae]|uniref:FkbM family methyltransferase n=2 Tax=Bradyrhizobium betae TaxID=244734 RepID=A0A5P6PB77_9BRAD|nr:FkbM family methyltransferase [Bradyrhizobium betae]
MPAERGFGAGAGSGIDFTEIGEVSATMFHRVLRDFAVKLFGLVAQIGFNSRLFRRVFLAFYSVYKSRLEAGPVDELRRFVPEGSVVIDVGANVGFFSLRFASWVGPRGEVILLEPEDRNFEALQSLVVREGMIERSRLMKVAAAETSGKAMLKINPQHPGDHKLSLDDTGVPIDTVRLDDLLSDKGRSRPSLIKIDVQGAELSVLRGAPDILRHARPALFVELDEDGLRKFGASVADVLCYLKDFGYDAFWLEKGGKRTAASQSDIATRIAKLGYVDVLFLNADGKSSGQEDVEAGSSFRGSGLRVPGLTGNTDKSKE